MDDTVRYERPEVLHRQSYCSGKETGSLVYLLLKPDLTGHAQLGCALRSTAGGGWEW